MKEVHHTWIFLKFPLPFFPPQRSHGTCASDHSRLQHARAGARTAAVMQGLWADTQPEQSTQNTTCISMRTWRSASCGSTHWTSASASSCLPGSPAERLCHCTPTSTTHRSPALLGGRARSLREEALQGIPHEPVRPPCAALR